jgi:hypothetical protein
MLIYFNIRDSVNVDFAALTMNRDLGFSPAQPWPVLGVVAGVTTISALAVVRSMSTTRVPQASATASRDGI